MILIAGIVIVIRAVVAAWQVRLHGVFLQVIIRRINGATVGQVVLARRKRVEHADNDDVEGEEACGVTFDNV
jgi:hypothetical protein